MGNEFKTECITKDGQKVEIVYNEKDNTWDFRINKRIRTRPSLNEAKETILNYQPDERVKREKVKFEKFKALKIGEVPYRLNYMNGEKVEIGKVVEVNGLKEGQIGSGRFNLVKYEDGRQEDLRLTSRDKTLVYLNENNLNAVKEIQANAERLYKLYESEVVKESEIQKRIEELEKELSVKKSEFQTKLEPIEIMEEFDWNVMSTRELRKQQGVVGENAVQE